jgi:hypothetical protein
VDTSARQQRFGAFRHHGERRLAQRYSVVGRRQFGKLLQAGGRRFEIPAFLLRQGQVFEGGHAIPGQAQVAFQHGNRFAGAIRLQEQGAQVVQRIRVVGVKAERLAQQGLDVRVEFPVRKQLDAVAVQGDGKQFPCGRDIAAQLDFRSADRLRLVELPLRQQFPCPLQPLAHGVSLNPDSCPECRHYAADHRSRASSCRVSNSKRVGSVGAHIPHTWIPSAPWSRT